MAAPDRKREKRRLGERNEITAAPTTWMDAALNWGWTTLVTLQAHSESAALLVQQFPMSDHIIRTRFEAKSWQQA